MNSIFEEREALPLFTESLRIFSNLSGHQGTQDPSVTDPVPLILRMLRSRDPKQVSYTYTYNNLVGCLFVCLFVYLIYLLGINSG